MSNRYVYVNACKHFWIGRSSYVLVLEIPDISTLNADELLLNVAQTLALPLLLGCSRWWFKDPLRRKKEMVKGSKSLFLNNQLKINIPKGTYWEGKTWVPFSSQIAQCPDNQCELSGWFSDKSACLPSTLEFLW